MDNNLLQYCLLATAFASFLWTIVYSKSTTRKVSTFDRPSLMMHNHWYHYHELQLSMIPSVGPSGTLTSYFGALRSLQDYNKPIQEGYEKYGGGFFKVPLLDRWMVMVTGKELLQEYSRAKESDLSINHAIATVNHE